MQSRAYIKRIWRVPKDRGPVEYFATLLCKALIKHGWPAVWHSAELPGYDAFVIGYHPDKGEPGPDFWAAVEIAVRITARTYRVDCLEHRGFVELTRRYIVTPRGDFKEVKDDLSRKL